jgi:hypothetical protein
MKISLCCLLLILLIGATNPSLAQQRQPAVEGIKIQVNRLGTGEKAKAKVTLKNGSKVKGYISEAGDQSFVVRDRKTNAPTTIAYADVMKVERSKGHSMARNVAIGVGIGVGAVLAVIFITIAHLD